jgi:D-3-phosphoglycerate dehydrogenase
MRLLIADKLDMRPLEELTMLGVEIVSRPELGPDDLPSALEGVNILVVRSTRVTAEAIDAAGELGLIIRAGAGVNTIDVAAASGRGIFVTNCPGKNAAAVAELTMAHILALDRRLVDATVALREGRWEKTAFQAAPGLFGKRLGVAGVGEIGRLVVARAQAFGMHVHAWSRSLGKRRAAELGVTPHKSLLQLARVSDVLSLHLPLDDQTRAVVNREVLMALPDGAIFVNISRAGVVDEAALGDAIRAKKLRVGLDVFDGEPKEGSCAFRPAVLDAGTVYTTPHIGASTLQAQHATATEVARTVRAFLTEEDVPNVVNVCRNTPARYALILRGRDEVGVLANVFGVLKRHGLNVEECSNTVFDGAQATCTKLRLSSRPGDTCLAELRAFDEVLHVSIVQLPNMA